MFSRRKAAKRFNLLLLEEEEYYVADWVASCNWPSSISGNWQGAQSLPGRLRLCTKSLFFDPDDIRVPIVRCETFCQYPISASGIL
jgi:factor associated with neutral sphingomyelinase activation